MSANTELPPALTAEEWANLNHPYAGNILAESIAAIVGRPGWYNEIPKIMALANAALPPSPYPQSPYKITQQDIKAIVIRSEAFPELAPIAAKLAALLPPDVGRCRCGAQLRIQGWDAEGLPPVWCCPKCGEAYTDRRGAIPPETT